MRLFSRGPMGVAGTGWHHAHGDTATTDSPRISGMPTYRVQFQLNLGTRTVEVEAENAQAAHLAAFTQLANEGVMLASFGGRPYVENVDDPSDRLMYEAL